MAFYEKTEGTDILEKGLMIFAVIITVPIVEYFFVQILDFAPEEIDGSSWFPISMMFLFHNFIVRIGVAKQILAAILISVATASPVILIDLLW